MEVHMEIEHVNLTKMKEIKYISTDNLDAVIVEGDYIKIIVYNKVKSPYGWTKREMRHAAYGVDEKEFNYNYIKKAVDSVFNVFPDEQIKELIKKVKKYYDKNKNKNNKQVG